MYGEFEPVGGGCRIWFTRRFDQPPERVWQVMTDPREQEEWAPAVMRGPREPGAQLCFVFPGEPEDPADPAASGRMVAWAPPAALEFTWAGDAIRFDLRPEGGGTALSFSTTMDGIGQAARAAAGWHRTLDALGAHLSGRPDPQEEAERGRSLFADYAERFGPEASAVGPLG